MGGHAGWNERGGDGGREQKVAQQRGRFFPGSARDPEVRLDQPHFSAASTAARLRDHELVAVEAADDLRLEGLVEGRELAGEVDRAVHYWLSICARWSLPE